MAALYGMQVDNALIKLEGAEIPIMDGSALPFVEAIETVGLKASGLNGMLKVGTHNVLQIHGTTAMQRQVPIMGNLHHVPHQP